MIGNETCAVCGAHPALKIPIRRHVGMLILQKFYKVDKPLCRTHGMELSRSWLQKTAIEGWWGVISFLVNWFVVAGDLIALSKYSKLAVPIPAPQPPQDQSIAPTGWGSTP